MMHLVIGCFGMRGASHFGGPVVDYQAYAREPMAALVAHINREALHHGAEIALRRDLYRCMEK
jgi:hypothetical protein